MANNDSLVFDKLSGANPDENQDSRTENLIGINAVNKLRSAKIALFGLGGVGSYVLEALARVGIGKFILVDNDHIVKSNINRQLLALHSSVGRLKTDCAKERIADINPDAKVECFPLFYAPETASTISESLQDCSYIIDAIDTVSAKILLIQEATRLNIPIISCMGTGNKLNPSRFEVSDIYKTSVCPLARVMRHELKVRGIKKLKVVYSRENPQKNHPPASISFVPATAGLLVTREVVKDLVDIIEKCCFE